ncbi:MAG TPA: DNA repair protein RadA [Dehalococcoidia bacterium]|nr:DNA repair protein RadA [Dehalococcoidia bacterium]
MTTARSGKPPRTVFACQECGYEAPKWLGRCPDCASWNSFEERARERGTGSRATATAAPPIELAGLSHEDEPRLAFGLAEFDRVLGGGAVAGSLALIGGDPGIGKSTLLLQVASLVAGANGRPAHPEQSRRVLYLSGEESARQVKLRAARLGVRGNGLFVLTETNLDAALREAESLSPALLIVDSIQTVYSEAASQAPGSVAQLRQCTMDLMRWSKVSGVPAFIVGHVTKEGDIAGPRLLEHIVDVVLYLEGERFSSYRLLRSVKNRFGSIDEVGVFEMTGEGMAGVDNASEAFIAERASGAAGSVVAPTLEGSRPLLVEVQALTSPTAMPTPRRTANGLDFNRLLLVTAVLTRRAGLALAGQDVIASVVGGLRVHEPATDLALALAIVSSHRDKPVPPDLVAVGEIGLSGELRSVSQVERRLAEAERLGFRRCLLPEASVARAKPKTGLELLPAATLREAVRLAFGG